jgi:hypothetical protein
MICADNLKTDASLLEYMTERYNLPARLRRRNRPRSKPEAGATA